jgi:hypothetical protein
MHSIFTAGVALWLDYGLILCAWPMVAVNAKALALPLFILVTKPRCR